MANLFCKSLLLFSCGIDPGVLRTISVFHSAQIELWDFRVVFFQSEDYCPRWILHQYLAPENSAGGPPKLVTDKLTLFLIIIHCQQQVSKDNYSPIHSQQNTGHCTISLIDYFCCAGHLTPICFTCKVRQNEKNGGAVERTQGECE